jgi:hypothetical protein
VADNVVADAGAGGSTFAAAELSFSGDTVIVPGSFVGLLSGSEGSWTFSLVVGGAGAVAAGVQRMTLASDDPAVAKLGTIDTDTGNIATSTATIAGAVSGSEMQVDIVSGSVTANAGTNLNTSALALEAGGNLAGAATSLAVMDDWDNGASDGASVSGDVAHDAADAGEPVKIGAKASTSLSGLTLVANADRTNVFAGIDGVQITRPHTNLEDIVTGVAAITDGSSTSVIASAGAGVKIYITEVIIANSSASNVTVDLRDGAAGSVKATFSAPATGGSHKTLSVPLPFSAATAVCADPSAAASTVTVTLVGFKSKV